METQPSSSPLLGNRYQLQQVLGKGGMADVYKARDLMLERPVAIKVLRQDYSREPGFQERFRHEAKAAANLSHPNIVTVYDFGFDQDYLYIVMEFIPGTDLKTMMRNRGQFTLDEAIPLAVQACAGVGYAHRSGLVHCDVKPHNMLVSPDGRLKVTDFGIARALSSIHPDEQNDVVWGSPLYFSPEQAAGLAPSPASDVYSLGIVLYEMLTGRLPFNSEDPNELARMHREVSPIPPRQFNPSIPATLDQIILKILSKEPSSRYRTADQLGRVLINFSHKADAYSSNIPSFTPSLAPIPSPLNSQPVREIVTQGSVFTETQPSPHAEILPEEGVNIDWGTVSLGLLTTIALGGLIPFWLYIILILRSPLLP